MPQELFNLAIIKQGRPARTESRMCFYRHRDGTKCAVGHLITDEEYLPEMEGYGAQKLYDRGLLPARLRPHLDLLHDLQQAHDQSSPDNFIPEFKQRMATSIARRHNLDVPTTAL